MQELYTEKALFEEAWSIIYTYHKLKLWDSVEAWKIATDRARRLWEKGKGSERTEALSKALATGVLQYLVGKGGTTTDEQRRDT